MNTCGDYDHFEEDWGKDSRRDCEREIEMRGGCGGVIRVGSRTQTVRPVSFSSESCENERFYFSLLLTC